VLSDSCDVVVRCPIKVRVYLEREVRVPSVW
jgi:hypothetical protein